MLSTERVDRNTKCGQAQVIPILRRTLEFIYPDPGISGPINPSRSSLLFAVKSVGW